MTAHALDLVGNPDKPPLKVTMDSEAAAVIFKGRRRPVHVRILVDGA